MIGNQAALRPEYVPRDLYHREGQLEVLRRSLTPLSAGLTAENVGIYGATGSGKTTIARYALEQVDHELTTGQWSYVNCFSTPSTTAVLRAATADAGLEVPIDPAGTTAQTYIERLRDADEPIVIVLDEAGALPDLKLLGTLYELPTTSFVAIAIDEASFLADVEPGIRSRVQSAETIRLDRYSIDELVDILRGRIEQGIQPRYRDQIDVEAIADRAAGDARLAITLLRRGAMHVRAEGLDELSAAVVDKVESGARDAIREQHLDSLGTHKRLLYEIIEEASEIDATDLHDAYEERAVNPKSKPTRRRYLRSLEDYELIERVGDGRGTRYRTPGPR